MNALVRDWLRRAWIGLRSVFRHDAGARKTTRQETGEWGENIAAKQLRKEGYTIAGRRVRPDARNDEIDEALVMTVHPGYGGQKFIEDCLPKVAWLRGQRPELDIMVDGGVNGETALLAAKSGANQFVAGSYLFAQKDMAAAVADLKRRLA